MQTIVWKEKSSKRVTFILQAPTPEVKTEWVKEIRKVLTQQLNACRGRLVSIFSLGAAACHCSELLFVSDARQQKSSDSVSPNPTSNNTPVSLRSVSCCMCSFQKEGKSTEQVSYFCSLPAPSAAAIKRTTRSRRRRRRSQA